LIPVRCDKHRAGEIFPLDCNPFVTVFGFTAEPLLANITCWIPGDCQ